VIRIPRFPLELVPSLLGDAAGLALVTFSSMMLTSRSFASKNRYDVNADREFAALGAANIASALSEGFAVSGADSRTAMSDTVGGRTQVTGLVAAAAIGIVLLFFTGPLRYVPVAALGAVLVKAALSLVEIPSLRTIYRIDRREFALSVIALLGVVAVGAIRAILFAVVLAILRFVRLISRPKVEILGKVKGFPGFHSIERHSEAVPYFKREVLAAAQAVGPSLKWLVIDMLPITMIDATGLYTAEEVFDTLKQQGVVLSAVGRKTEWRLWAESHHRDPQDRKIQLYPTFREAIRVYRRAHGITDDSEEIVEPI